MADAWRSIVSIEILRPQSIGTVVVLLCAISHSSVENASYAETITIDENRTIDATNSFPDPGPFSDGLLVEIVDGTSGSTEVSMVDGGFIGGALSILDTSEFQMLGGRVEGHTLVADSGTLTLAGGGITCAASYCAADDVAYVVHGKDNGTINFRGGVISTDLRLDDFAVANIFGSSFVVEGELPFATGNPSGVRIRGLYDNGVPFDITIIREIGTAQVFLHITPEPASSVFSLLGALLLSRTLARGIKGDGSLFLTPCKISDWRGPSYERPA